MMMTTCIVVHKIQQKERPTTRQQQQQKEDTMPCSIFSISAERESGEQKSSWTEQAQRYVCDEWSLNQPINNNHQRMV
jgi:hypothetical protein